MIDSFRRIVSDIMLVVGTLNFKPVIKELKNWAFPAKKYQA